MKKNAKWKEKIKGNVEVRHVSLSYNGEDRVLDDVSFSVRKGETVAIVGATGAGKTSLLHLLERFYEVQEGAIFLDGIDIREWDGVKKWQRFTLEGTSRLSEVRIDPSGILLFDINPLNNRRTSAYQGEVVLTLTSRILFYLQNMAFILSSLI